MHQHHLQPKKSDADDSTSTSPGKNSRNGSKNSSINNSSNNSSNRNNNSGNSNSGNRKISYTSSVSRKGSQDTRGTSNCTSIALSGTPNYQSQHIESKQRSGRHQWNGTRFAGAYASPTRAGQNCDVF